MADTIVKPAILMHALADAERTIQIVVSYDGDDSEMPKLLSCLEGGDDNGDITSNARDSEKGKYMQASYYNLSLTVIASVNCELTCNLWVHDPWVWVTHVNWSMWIWVATLTKSKPASSDLS